MSERRSMMGEGVDWLEVFEGLGQAVAVCEPDGSLVAANALARERMGVASLEGVRLDLDARETVNALGVARRGAGHEFYLHDVTLRGAPVSTCSVMCAPLSGGGFRVTFVEAKSRQLDASPGVRLMRALGAAGDHAALFTSPAELTALFGAAAADAFPGYAIHLSVSHEGAEPVRFERAEDGFGARREREPQRGFDWELGRTELLWKGSRSGGRFVIDGERVTGLLHVELVEPRGLTAPEREACELFAYVFAFMSSRYLGADGATSAAGVDALSPIMNSLNAAVVMCDERRLIRTCNAAFEAAVGAASSEELVGRDVTEFFDESVAADVRARAAAAMSGTGVEPMRARLRDGGMELSVHVAPLGDEQAPTGFMLVGQVEAQAIDRLERELERAEQLMQLGQLATGVAHELKNPLTSILNYADYLLQKYRDQLFERRDSERLQRIIEGVERMDGFVRDLVTLARPHEGGPAERVDVHDVLRESVMLCDISLRQRSASVRQSLESHRPHILASRSQLTQIFVNLIQNSAMALEEGGGFIEIVTLDEPDRVLVEISDDGCGMSPDELARVFEPFYTTRRGTGGSGLGMVLVRSLVERHGGALSIESAAGEGTTVRIAFPAAAEDSPVTLGDAAG